jgi:hypothetical protein
MSTTNPRPLLTLSQVCRPYAGARGARHVTPSTVTRWILSGCPARDGTRVRLPATRVGCRWLVSPADLNAFFARLAADPADVVVAPPTKSAGSRVDRAAAAAAAELIRRGA